MCRFWTLRFCVDTHQHVIFVTSTCLCCANVNKLPSEHMLELKQKMSTKIQGSIFPPWMCLRWTKSPSEFILFAVVAWNRIKAVAILIKLRLHGNFHTNKHYRHTIHKYTTKKDVILVNAYLYHLAIANTFAMLTPLFCDIVIMFCLCRHLEKCILINLMGYCYHFKISILKNT